MNEDGGSFRFEKLSSEVPNGQFILLVINYQNKRVHSTDFFYYSLLK